MIPNRTVLIGWNDRLERGSEPRERFTGWVERLGFEPAVAPDGRTAISWVRERPFAASLLDAALLGDTGEEVWRRVRPILGRRLVLMAREMRSDIIFEALRSGVGALLPLPARECMVRAALDAVTRCEGSGRVESER